jgi:hypothetical protein
VFRVAVLDGGAVDRIAGGAALPAITVGATAGSIVSATSLVSNIALV